MEGEGREIIYLSLHCHHQNDFYIKMGSDKSHFNVSVGSDGQEKVTGQCPQITTFLKRKESRSGIEPRSFRLPAFARPNRLTQIMYLWRSLCTLYLHACQVRVTVSDSDLCQLLYSCYAFRELIVVVAVDRFYIAFYVALFSALDKTHCARM